ncbi:uncharacterized protein LOC101850279 [Aplysia californica]|uniref:Uncharacterized protein LOC101850279 n=1 Tax=Aplysia californica TaxID=6500 RepID=A0ABM1W069_APLCA|nr:uncharacterized protein LOC101850279 [Aplysia californica]
MFPRRSLNLLGTYFIFIIIIVRAVTTGAMYQMPNMYPAQQTFSEEQMRENADLLNSMKGSWAPSVGGKGILSLRTIPPITTTTGETSSAAIEESDDFGFAFAVEMGPEYQTEFCPSTCHAKVNRSRQCIESAIKCARRRCGQICGESGECCFTADDSHNDSPNVDSSHLTDDSISNNLTSCITARPNLSDHIVSSCPEQDMIAFISNTKEQMLAVQEKRREMDACITCLFADGHTSFITSTFSNKTYCNHHCLRCNEGDILDEANLVLWEKETFCQIIDANKNEGDGITRFDESTAKDNTSLTHFCTSTFLEPEDVIERSCDVRLLGTTFVDSCHPRLDMAVSVDLCLALKMAELCRSFTWPIYDEDTIYRNMFCYMCQANVPTSRRPVVRMHFEGTESYVVTVSLITAISDVDAGASIDDYDDEDDEEEGEEEDGVYSDKEKRGGGGGDGSYDASVEEEADESIVSVMVGDGDTQRCEEGYWREPGEGQCRLITCSSGRNLMLDSNGEVQTCIPQKTTSDISADSYIYVLTMAWYVHTNVSRADRGSHQYDADHKDMKSETESFRKQSKLGRRILHSNKKDRSRKKYSRVRKFPPTSTGLQTQDGPIRGQKYDDSNNSGTFLHGSAGGQSPGIGSSVREHIGNSLEEIGRLEYLFQIYPAEVQQNLSSTVLRPVAMSLLYIAVNRNESVSHVESLLLRKFTGYRQLRLQSQNISSILVLAKHRNESLRSDVESYFPLNKLSGKCCAVSTNIFTNYTKEFRRFSCSDPNETVTFFDSVTSCPHVTFDISEFNTTKRHSLIHTRSRLRLKRHRYLYQGKNEISVCIKDLNEAYQKRRTKRREIPLQLLVEHVLTLSAFPLSMACLLLTFVTYCVFPVLRSVPGKNNMVLIALLFLAQALLLTTPLPRKRSTLCSVLGMALHTSWLAAFTWMSVCSFHMFHVFVVRRASPRPQLSRNWFLFRYVIISSVAVTSCVGLVIITELYASNGRSFGYGERVCYLNSFFLVGVAFLLPLSLILVINLTLFAMTVFTISRIEDVKREAGQERRNIHVYARLSSLTGLCWLLALLAEIPGLQVLRCVSVLVNGSQGVVIFLSYACNRRVIRMWKHLLKNRKGGLSRQFTDTSRQGTMSTSV